MNYELTEVPVEDKSSKFQLHNKCDSVVKCQIHILNELNFHIQVSHKVSEGRCLTENKQFCIEQCQNGKILGSQYMCTSTKQTHSGTQNLYLQITIVSLWKSLAQNKKGGQASYNSSRLSTNQFHWVWIFLLRHNTTSCGDRVIWSDESKFFRCPHNPFLTKTGKMNGCD